MSLFGKWEYTALTLRKKYTEIIKKSMVYQMCRFDPFPFIRGKIRWTEKAFAKFKSELKRLTGRSWFVSMDYRMKKLGQYIRGWINYYGISEYYRSIPGLDQWLRRRIRMCYWKQWPRCRTRVKNLARQGLISIKEE